MVDLDLDHLILLLLIHPCFEINCCLIGGNEIHQLYKSLIYLDLKCFIGEVTIENNKAAFNNW